MHVTVNSLYVPVHATRRFAFLRHRGAIGESGGPISATKRAVLELISQRETNAMSTNLRVRATLLRELGKIAAQSNQDVSELAEDALREFVRSHRETAHLTSSSSNVQRLRVAHAEIEAAIARRRHKAA